MKLHYIKSSFYSFVHSPALLVSILTPLCGALFFLLYYTVRSMSAFDKFSFFTITLAGVFPLIISILITIIESSEANTHFQLMLSAPTFKFKPHAAKLITLLVSGLSSSLLAMIVFCMGMNIESTPLSMSFCLETGAILLLGNIPLYFLQYLISFSFGKGASLGFGIVGTILSMVLLTGAGDKTRMFLPWGFSGEFINSFILSKTGGDISLYCTSLTQAVITSAVTLALLIAVLTVWSAHFEGQSQNEA